ncbi:MAG: DUF4394 domain-containing protein, partial [Acidobacteriota bacterium]|nr:DUF4394 domain-containing protein [Acidobacteriota bacterium]
MRQIVFTLLLLSGLLLLTASRVDAEPLVALNTGGNGFEFNQRLFIFDSTAPSAIISTTQVTGLVSPGERLVGIDYRPSDGQLYGISLAGSSNRIYTINPQTGVAAFVATVSPGLGQDPGSGISGMDFDPTTGRLRVVNVNGRNLNVNVETGEAIVEGTVMFA